MFPDKMSLFTCLCVCVHLNGIVTGTSLCLQGNLHHQRSKYSSACESADKGSCCCVPEHFWEGQEKEGIFWTAWLLQVEKNLLVYFWAVFPVFLHNQVSKNYYHQQELLSNVLIVSGCDSMCSIKKTTNEPRVLSVFWDSALWRVIQSY